jgi:hypothetical protein
MAVKKTTPAGAEKASQPNKKFTLPESGLEVEKIPFKGKHVRQAQRLTDGDMSKAQFAIISVACLVDGKPITIEELDELPGVDVMAMIAEFEGLFS